MFDKILIANRGEIACRVIDTARRMGIATVAVHSDADRDARHVEMADEAVPIGPPPPAESYLRGDLIIEAALATGARAIHPGYGFLSENPEFVEAVEAAGLVFIGPSAGAIRAMGLKDAAKAMMAEAGVPVVPGYHGENQEDAHLAGAAREIGYPVLIKAVAGGGGKGMRRVDAPEAFAEALAAARSEALKAFGNGAVLIEKFVEKPRHIEVQVFGDGARAVHLFERDCSLQRRHQKVIEESPAPGMTDDMRAAMGQAAVRAAEAIGYSGAGTVEFIVDASDGLRPDRFWFMEMNTRLQVEHPVTEAVTGVDLVELQLRVASGEPLPVAQEALKIDGHAIEARLYAEDPARGFLPATGRIVHMAAPEGVRVDTGVRSGDTISPHYDPMIAKLVAHGPTRNIALNRLASALDELEIAGTITNRTFLTRLCRLGDVRRGEVHTGLIERQQEALTEADAPGAGIIALAIMAALDAGGNDPLSGFVFWRPLRWETRLIGENGAVEATVLFHGTNRAEVAIEDARVALERGSGVWRIPGDSRHHARRFGDRVAVFGPGGAEFTVPDPLAIDAHAGHGGDIVEAPMPGQIKAVYVSAGDTLSIGDRVATLEAMKMEHTLTAARDGVVAEVMVAAGEQIEAGAALVRLEERNA